MARRKISFSLLLLFPLVAVILATTGCGRQAPSPPTVRVLSAREYLDEAWDLALQWRSDAELKAIEADILAQEEAFPPYVHFTFESPGEDTLKFDVSCSMAGCSALASWVPATSGWGSIEFEDEMIDSLEAALIGLRNGGEQFISQEKDVTMTVRLLRDLPRTTGPVVWEAYFASLDREPLYVVIDPYTGEVIRVEE